MKLRFALVLALLFSSLNAMAQLASVPTAGIELTKIEVLHNVPANLTLAQVQSGQAGNFVQHDSLQVTHTHWYRAMWLRLHLKVKPATALPAQPAVMALATSYLDKVRLYSPGAQPSDPWLVQQAGDFYAPHTWSTRSFYPKFNLPDVKHLMPEASQDVVLYMQMAHLAPVVLQLEITDAKESLDQDLLQFLLLSLGLGAILLSTLLTAAMAWLHRDAIYAWYSLYALSAAIACASHAGIAIHIFWPTEGYWPSAALLCFILIAALAQMQFALVLNAKATTTPALRYLVHACSAACMAMVIGFPLYIAYWQAAYVATFSLLACAMILCFSLMIIALRAGHRLAGVWMLANVPLFGSIVLAFSEAIGYLSSSSWSRSLPIYATYFEVLILGLALQWFARERHGHKEREKALAATDPLTGFATVDAFKNRLLRDWHSQETKKHDLAVAYIELKTKAVDKQHMQQMLMRSVRVLRTATGAHDMVARLDGQLLGVLMSHVSMDDDLGQRLSRIVALGLMLERSDPQATVLQFRIAATTRLCFTKPLDQLDAQLRDLLVEPRGWGSKPIRYIDHSLAARVADIKLEDDIDLEELWDQALKRQTNDAKAQAPI